MNSNYEKLVKTYQQNWTEVIKSDDLKSLAESYVSSEDSREEVLTWIFENVQNEEEQQSYFESFGKFESEMIMSDGDVPIFDEEFDIFESFDEYEAYYQRYGCLTPEFVVSWDSDSVLFDDGDSVELIQRPDVLMGGND